MSITTLDSVAIEGQVRSGVKAARTIQRNRRIVVPRYGGPEVMTIVEESIPEPRPKEIRVRIIAAGVGYPDVLIREGMYPRGPRSCGYRKVDPREILRVLSELGGPASTPRTAETTHETVEFTGRRALRMWT
jgi:hypothetical protein